MSTNIKNTFKWFGSSRSVTIGLTVIGGALLAACSPVADEQPIGNTATPETTVEATATPEVTATGEAEATNTPEPTVSAEASAYELEVKDYVVWNEGDEIRPGVYIEDSEGEKGEKPENLTGYSAYFMDGAWYVFDGSAEIPDFVQDTYLNIPEDITKGEAGTRHDEFLDLNLCAVIMRDVNGKATPNMFIMDKGTGELDPTFIADGNGISVTYSSREEGAEAYWNHYADEIDNRCYNQELLVLNSDNMTDDSF